ncbi:MAG: PQQ-binding-like beta-propeller repeat protein [Cyclobacteriaceae bacterium]
MTGKHLFYTFPSLLILSLLCWLGLRSPLDGWEKKIAKIGTFSSPGAADLNADGVLDVVIGAGGEEFEARDTAVIALDGRSGEVLWAVSGQDQFFSKPIFNDINQDGVPDVLMAGRSAQLIAIDGKSGCKLWDFSRDQAPRFKLFNFYTPVVVPDQDEDGISDLIVANGGDVSKKAYEKDRASGRLMLISGSDGTLIRSDTMPDGKETYMSPVLHDDGQASLVFGSGGETIGGHLYLIKLKDFVESGLRDVSILASDSLKGFIAPPLLQDLNADGIQDIVVNAVAGRILVLDGKDKHLLWEVIIPDTELYTTAAAGNFNDDPIPDLFINAGKGIWPDMSQCLQLALDGRDGSILFEDSLSFMSMSSPLALDVNDDGTDEALLSINFQRSRQTYRGIPIGKGIVYSKLVAFDIANHKRLKLAEDFKGANLSVTSWLGDLDDDGHLDLLHAYHTDTSNFTAFNGLSIIRRELDIPVSAIRTSSYLP